MKLFKYLTESRTSILRDGLIRFTPPQAFNDPFELKPCVDSFGTESQISETVNQQLMKLLKSSIERHLPLSKKQ